MDIEIMRHDERIAWASGLYEAEGSLGRSQTTVRMNLSSVDLEIVEWFHQAVGMGKLYGPYQRGSSQPQYTWQLVGWEKVLHLFQQLYPWLGHRRRRQGDDVLSDRFVRPLDDGNWKPGDAHLSQLWAAGIFEGEGSVCLSRSTCATKITMTDVDTLGNFRQAIGDGIIFGPYQRETGKAYYIWHLSGWEKATMFAVRLSPYLGERRIKQFETVLAAWPAPVVKTYPPPCGYLAPQVPSESGYMYHLRRGEPCCSACAESRGLARRRRLMRQKTR